MSQAGAAGWVAPHARATQVGPAWAAKNGVDQPGACRWVAPHGQCGMHKRLGYFLIEDMPLMHGHPTSRSHLEWMHRPTPTIMHVLALQKHFYAASSICLHVRRTGDAPYSRGQAGINSEGQVGQHQDHSPVDLFCGSCMARMLTNGSWVGCPIASQGDTNTNTDTTYGQKSNTSSQNMCFTNCQLPPTAANREPPTRHFHEPPIANCPQPWWNI